MDTYLYLYKSLHLIYFHCLFCLVSLKLLFIVICSLPHVTYKAQKLEVFDDRRALRSYGIFHSVPRESRESYVGSKICYGQPPLSRSALGPPFKCFLEDAYSTTSFLRPLLKRGGSPSSA